MSLRANQCLPLDHIKGAAEFDRAVYHVVIPKQFVWNDCLVPEFWRYQEKLKANDILELVAETGEFDCRVRVVNASPGYAVLRVLNTWFAPAESLQGQAASIGFILGRGWVLFGSDSEPVATFVEEEAAKTALDEYVASHTVQVEQ